MLKEQRQSRIRTMIKQNGEVETNNLCRLFGVAEMTIRRDLDKLALEDGITRTRGGAMLADAQMLVESSFDRRNAAHKHLKSAIARQALGMMRDGQTVFIDSGTTGYMLAQMLPGSLHMVVLTNAVNIAAELLTRPHIKTVMIGGELQPGTLSCRGTVAEETLSRFHIDTAFIGTNAVSANGDLYIGSVTETGFKKTILRVADKKYVMADSSKLGRFSLCQFATVRDVDGVITDSAASADMASALDDSGASLIVAKLC